MSQKALDDLIQRNNAEVTELATKTRSELKAIIEQAKTELAAVDEQIAALAAQVTNLRHQAALLNLRIMNAGMIAKRKKED